MHAYLKSTLPARSSILLSGLVAWLVLVFPRPAKSKDELNSSRPLTTQHSLRAKIYLTQGWATFGLALPAGVAREGLKAGSADTQTDVKTRWPDGSIRFCVVTTRVRKPGDYEVQASSRNPGKFQS
jgi:hypothetical protein